MEKDTNKNAVTIAASVAKEAASVARDVAAQAADVAAKVSSIASKAADNQDFILGQQVAELRGVVVEGFRGVHQRQDTTNGRVAKTELRVIDLEKLSYKNEGVRSGEGKSEKEFKDWWAIIATGISILIAIYTLLRH